MFFVDGDVWYQRPDDGDPDLVFDNGGRRACCHLLSAMTVALLWMLTAIDATRARIKIIKNGRLLAATGRTFVLGRK